MSDHCAAGGGSTTVASDELRLARLLDSVDTYTYNFDPYDPDISEGLLSDDLVSIATDLANGLRHHKVGNVAEALWWC